MKKTVCHESRARKKRTALRWLVGLGLPLGAVLLAACCLLLQNTPPCIFYELTGLYCPGCGAGRAFLSLLHGELLLAFRYQPLMLLLFPFVAYYVLKVYIAFVFGKDVLPFFHISNGMAVALLCVIVAFWILRNIPVPPFTYLAPGHVGA